MNLMKIWRKAKRYKIFLISDSTIKMCVAVNQIYQATFTRLLGVPPSKGKSHPTREHICLIVRAPRNHYFFLILAMELSYMMLTRRQTPTWIYSGLR